jgi:hypothetical protein
MPAINTGFIISELTLPCLIFTKGLISNPFLPRSKDSLEENHDFQSPGILDPAVPRLGSG